MINLSWMGATAQRVCLTLSEASCSGTGPWGFELVSPVTGATVQFVAPDVSAAPGRYNEFLLQSVGPTSQDLENGAFYVPDPGSYFYTAYQLTPGATSVAGNVASVAERGYVRLRAADDPLPEFAEGDVTYTPTFDD